MGSAQGDLALLGFSADLVSGGREPPPPALLERAQIGEARIGVLAGSRFGPTPKGEVTAVNPVEWMDGISAGQRLFARALRTVRDSLPSYGSRSSAWG